MEEVEAYKLCEYPEFMIYSVNGEWRLHIRPKQDFFKFNPKLDKLQVELEE